MYEAVVSESMYDAYAKATNVAFNNLFIRQA